MWCIKFETDNGVWAVWHSDIPSSRRIFADEKEAKAYWNSSANNAL